MRPTTTIDSLRQDARLSVTIGAPEYVVVACNHGHEHKAVCQFRYGQHVYWLRGDDGTLTPCGNLAKCPGWVGSK